ncbi:hypothetical protein [Streptomyces avermitilis]|uniref:hypothetical protein n=1 Tax=Streptomyces avermitilis TaxID=33903 RepID=UPI00382F5681
MVVGEVRTGGAGEVGELPAFVIRRMLGFYQSRGDNWTRQSQGFGADYAAEVSRR